MNNPALLVGHVLMKYHELSAELASARIGREAQTRTFSVLRLTPNST
jgi:hypothetical protein